VGYELGIRERAGRWEITSISGAPALDDQRPESTPASTAAPTPPPSTPASPSESSTTTSFDTEPGA
jgi:hypothetical protein